MDCSTLIRIMQKIKVLVTLQKQSTVFSTKMKYLQKWTFTGASLLCGGRSWRTLCVCSDLSQCKLSSLSPSDKVDTFWRRGWRVLPLWGFSTWCCSPPPCLSSPTRGSRIYIVKSAILFFERFFWFFVWNKHTWYWSRAPRACSCKFFLAGVNFYRFNAKNWRKLAFFSANFGVNWQKLAKNWPQIGFFRCQFYSTKILPV